MVVVAGAAGRVENLDYGGRKRYLELPSQHPQHAVQAPLVDRGDFLHIGAIVQDGGVPAQRVVEYLQKHVGDAPP